jgi:hypothetical protein
MEQVFFIVKSFLVLRKIYGSERDEATGNWKILHNEELHKSALFARYY